MNRLLAISDIHGCFDTFYELVIKRLDLKKSDRLILLGDYIDRGDKSRELIDFIIDLKSNNYNITPLCGNHEWMLVEAYKNNDMLPLWYLNSGMTTLSSFIVREINELNRKYVDFFMNLKYYEETGNFIFVHAGFNDYAPDPFSDIHSMIWECRTDYSNRALKGKTIIHGHKPKTIEHVRRIIKANYEVIPIDTGCVYEKDQGYGYLSALELNSMNLICVERI